jgi:hypothetical protein
MNSNFRVRPGVILPAVSGLVLIAGLFAFRAQADSWDKATLITVDEPTQIENTYLAPGTYMLKLANSDRHIVQIFNRDRSHLINTVFAMAAYRINRTEGTALTFWETPPGTAKAVRTWYWPGDRDGQEFRYPSDLRQVAALTPPALPASRPPAEVAAVTPQETLAPPPVADSQPEPQQPQPAQEQEPVQIAQNVPPPAPPAPAAEQPAQTPADQSQASQSDSLPKTASPYPLIGLGGLLSLGLYLGLRAKQLM